jgi:RNA polymerase sigma factor (sigma-70 family)
MSDVELLEKHREGSEQAFADLVQRHLAWVFSVARRRVRDPHLAEDVAQAVFILLHRKAPRFGEDRAMMGWLHKTTCYATAVAMRSLQRRRRRETAAASLAPRTTEVQTEPQWQALAPMLDELVGQLGTPDREAILLRFYGNLTFAQVGAQTGVSEEAARKRVQRALEKLRRLAAQRGMSGTAASLGTTLAAHVIESLPPGLVSSITAGASAAAGSAAAASSAHIVKGVTLMMAYSSAKIAAVAAAILLVVLSGVFLISRDWNASAAQESDAGGARSEPAAQPAIARLSPFTGARWNGTHCQVLYNGAWYDLLAIDGQPIEKIVDFAQNQYRERWQKRIDEDLVEVLDAMNVTVKVAGDQKSGSVSLELRALDGKPLSVADALMTEGNRWAIWSARNPSIDLPSDGPMPNIRWNNDQPQVQHDGAWYDLVFVNEQPIGQITDFARKSYGDDWKRKVETNMPAILSGMGHAAGDRLTLQLATVDTPPGH